MIESGVMESESIEAVFAGHMHPELPAGHIGLASDVCNAASSTFHIRIKGRGGHGAQPHLCKDPLLAGAYLVLNQQTHLFGIRMTRHPLSVSALMVFYGMLAGVSDPSRKLAEVFSRIQRTAVASDPDAQPRRSGSRDRRVGGRVGGRVTDT